MHALKALAAGLIAFVAAFTGDVDLADSVGRVVEAIIAAIVNGGIVYAVPNYNYPKRPAPSEAR